MTEKEVRDILNVLFVAFPGSYRDWSKQQTDLAVRLWMRHFQNLPAQAVAEAVDRYICRNTAFAPSIGQIISIIKESYTAFNADREWDYIVYLVRYVDEGYYNKLQERPITKNLISASDIRAYKEGFKSMDTDRARFIRRYNEQKEKLEEEAIRSGDLSLMSPAVKEGLETHEFKRIESHI